MPLSKICDVVVTSAAEGEFSLDCTDHMVHMKAGSPAELQLWLGSLREVAAVNTRRAAEEERRHSEPGASAPPGRASRQ